MKVSIQISHCGGVLMFKRLVHVLASLTVLFLFSGYVPAASGDSSKANRVSGVFVAPELSSTTTSAEWDDSLRSMAAIGVDTVIIQYTLQTDSVRGNQAYFPYSRRDTVSGSLPARRQQTGHILAAAKKHGFKVFLGLQLAEREWFDENRYQQDNWLNQQCQLSISLADELWKLFGELYKGVIAGWYLPFEFESTPEYYGYFTRLATDYYSPVTTYLKNDARFGSLPVMISPLMYWSDNKTIWQNNLKTVLTGSRIDIVAPQDGIGFGTQTHQTIGDWFRVCRQAVDEVNKSGAGHVRLWGNCENYVRLRNPQEPDSYERLKPMSIHKFISSLDIAAPYVENLISFSIHRWDTAQSSSVKELNRPYYEAYKRYYTSGKRPQNLADGYYVAIRSEGAVTFHDQAKAQLTDGFAASGNWDQFRGIRTNGGPFTLEIRFDDPVSISRVASQYYQNATFGIALPYQVRYQYLVRSGSYDEQFTYRDIMIDRPSGNNSILRSQAALKTPIKADGIRITVTPSSEWTFLDDIYIDNFGNTATYGVTVENGTVDKPYAAVGESVILTARPPSSNAAFVRWESDDVAFHKPTSATTSFTMPGKSVRIRAVFRMNSSTHTGQPTRSLTQNVTASTHYTDCRSVYEPSATVESEDTQGTDAWDATLPESRVSSIPTNLSDATVTTAPPRKRMAPSLILPAICLVAGGAVATMLICRKISLDRQ